MKVFNQMCFTDRNIRPAPVELGTIWTDDFTGANLNDYTNAGSSGIALDTVNDELDFSGSFNNFVKHLQFSKSGHAHRYTMLEKWTQRFTVRTPSSLGSAFGFGCGVKSANAVDDFHMIGRWGWDDNTVYFYEQDAVGGNQVTRSTGYTVTTSTTYVVYLERNKNTLTYTVKSSDELTTHFSVSYNTMLTTTAGSNNFSANTGRFTLWNFQGNFSILDWTISSAARKYVDVVAIGDSNMAGRYAGTEGGRYVEQSFTSLGLEYEIFAGGGDRGTEVLLYLDEVLELDPLYVYLNIGSNDVASGQSSGTWQANMDSIISTLETAGIEVILGTPVARSVNLTAVQTYVEGLSNRSVDLFDVTKSGTALNGTYNSGDGIHMNVAGNNACATELATFFFDDVTAPIISNFRIKIGEPNRIYFDSSEALSGGGVLTGIATATPANVILTCVINGVSLTDHYFTMTDNFEFGDTPTISTTGADNITDLTGNGLAAISSTSITNNLVAGSPAQAKINFFTGASTGWTPTGSTSPFGGVDYGNMGDGIGVRSTTGWNATGSSGATGGSQAVFPNAIKQTYWYTSGASVGTLELYNNTGTPLTGNTFNIKIIGSRAGITGPRTTRYIVNGGTPQDLNTDDNTDNYVEFTGVSAISGVITVTIQNVSPSDAAFGYINGLIIASE